MPVAKLKVYKLTTEDREWGGLDLPWHLDPDRFWRDAAKLVASAILLTTLAVLGFIALKVLMR